ncbi:MAG: hypothetical protein ACP5R4_07455 [Armatimonadota bacterium]
MRETLEPSYDAGSLIEIVARKVVERRLEVPAVFFLEMNKPLSFIVGQSLLVAMPFLAPLLGFQRVEQLSALLQDRENVDRLIQRIEELSSRRRPGESGETGG